MFRHGRRNYVTLYSGTCVCVRGPASTWPRQTSALSYPPNTQQASLRDASWTSRNITSLSVVEGRKLTLSTTIERLFFRHRRTPELKWYGFVMDLYPIVDVASPWNVDRLSNIRILFCRHAKVLGSLRNDGRGLSCSRFLIGPLALLSANVAEMRIPTVLTTGRRIEILLQSSQLNASVDGGVVGDKRGERVPWCCRHLWELSEAIAASLNIRLWTEKIAPTREGRSGVFLAFDYWQRGQVAATAERRPIHSNSVRKILGFSENVYIRILMYEREKKINDREAMTFEVRGCSTWTSFSLL